MEAEIETKGWPDGNKKKMTVIKSNTKPSKQLYEFVQWYKQNISPKPLAASNCMIKAIIISIWPPYGLALPTESKYSHVGVILFHQCRIVESPTGKEHSGKIMIRSKNVSKYGIYTTKRKWPKAFHVGKDILTRIALPLNECSHRWRKQDKRDKRLGKEVKLSDLIQYKAVKLWSLATQDLNCAPLNEPTLGRRSLKFDQMQPLYMQWCINTDFCLNQLLGNASQRLIMQILDDNPSPMELSDLLSNCKIGTESSNNFEIKMSRENCGEVDTKNFSSNLTENNEIDSNTVSNFKCDNPVWIELEPVYDNSHENFNDSGILNLDCLSTSL